MTIAPPQELYGILGLPLAQTLSPVLHTWAFAETGVAGAYFTWEKPAGDLPDFFRAVRSLPIRGLSVTIPHKTAVLPYLDAVTPMAAAVGAVNTVFWEDGRLSGDNTDVAGFLAPLAGRPAALPQRALVLGAGGAARAVMAGLRDMRMPLVHVAARGPDKARALAADFGCLPLPWEEREQALAGPGPALVINATPLGMRGKAEGESPLPKAALERLARTGGGLVYDLVYAPLETRLLADARAVGLETVDGLDFFVAQGCEQFVLWTGRRLPLARARDLIRRRLLP